MHRTSEAVHALEEYLNSSGLGLVAAAMTFWFKGQGNYLG
jgi:hypothetical protein